jgi:uncharacterized membrane protein YbaN (DUF454 family)
LVTFTTDWVVMRQAIRRALRHTLGWGALAVGVAGLVLPVIQGWLFIALGALLLAPDVPFFAKLLDRIERRFPALRHPIARLRARFGPTVHEEQPPPPAR